MTDELMDPIKYIGVDYITPDLVAKVMGRAKYAEDFRADGMLFCKLLLSPYPHARVRRIDASGALAMPGVKSILTADDLPSPTVPVPPGGERPLTNEPHYQGEPVLAVAAVDELTAADAIEKIRDRMGSAAVRRGSVGEPQTSRCQCADSRQRVVAVAAWRNAAASANQDIEVD